MDERAIKTKLEAAAKTLFDNQPDIFDFKPSQSGQTEWNLAHHLANEIHKYFASFHCDVDITKRNFSNRRPDIVIHKRGPDEFNFLVIEMKRNAHNQSAEIKSDRDKIKRDWFSNPLNYKFGAIININNDMTFEVEVIKNNNMECTKALAQMLTADC